jgi:tyrosyl-tRNA synthetase
MSERMKNFLKDLEKREIISNCANLKNFYDLKESERVIYIGIDCTAESLHVGHLFSIIQMIRFVKEGFRAIILLGGATSRIGDPSDKLKERPQLEKKKIEDFTKSIENQLKRILFREKIDIKDISSKKKLSPLENFYQDKELIEKIYEVLSIKREESKEAK